MLLNKNKTVEAFLFFVCVFYPHHPFPLSFIFLIFFFFRKLRASETLPQQDQAHMSFQLQTALKAYVGTGCSKLCVCVCLCVKERESVCV